VVDSHQQTHNQDSRLDLITNESKLINGPEGLAAPAYETKKEELAK